MAKQSGGSDRSPRGRGKRLEKDDLLTIKVIEKWSQTAAEEVDTIGGWRDADPSDRLHKYWALADADGGTMPNQFYSDTTYLLGWVVSNHAKLDPTPLQDVYDAVSAWHGDHNAERVPGQRVLAATLDRAMQVVGAVEMAVLNNSSPPTDDWQDRSPTLEERISSGHAILESLLPMEPPDSGFDETTDLRATSDELWLALRRFRRGLIEGGSFPPAHWFHQLCDIGQKAHEMGLRPHWGSEQYIAASPTSLRKTDPTGGWEDIPSEMVVVLIGAGEYCFLETCYLCDGFINPQQRREAILWSEGWMRAGERQLLDPQVQSDPIETHKGEASSTSDTTKPSEPLPDDVHYAVLRYLRDRGGRPTKEQIWDGSEGFGRHLVRNAITDMHDWKWVHFPPNSRKGVGLFDAGRNALQEEEDRLKARRSN